MKTFAIFSALLVIGIANTQAARVVIDIKATEHSAISDVETKSIEFKNQVGKLTSEFSKVAEDFQELARPALSQFHDELSKISGFLENTLETYTNFNISKSTCGIVGIRDYVMSTYDIGNKCLEDVLENIKYEMDDMSQGTTRMTQEFEVMKKKIRRCKKEHTDNDKIANCILEEAAKAEESLKSLGKITVGVRKSIQLYKTPAVLTTCLTEGTSTTLTRKVREVVNCLGEKVPGFAGIAHKISDLALNTEMKLSSMINGLSNVVNSFFYKVEDRVVPILRDIDLLASSFKRSIATFFGTMKNIFKQIIGVVG